MKVITTNISPPIPVRSADWMAYFDGMEEDGPYGYGATELEAKNSLIDNTDTADLMKWFGIETRELDTLRGPEYGYWIAYTDTASVEAAWEDQAVADLVAKLIGAE